MTNFRFQTLEDVRRVAQDVADRCPDPCAILPGLSELMLNAVEHGNLGISYEEKTSLMRDGKWQEEIERRLQMPERAARFAQLNIERNDQAIKITIIDQGDGFDWKPFMQFCPTRRIDPNGRGIALAMVTGFSSVEFCGSGNMVVCTIQLD